MAAQVVTRIAPSPTGYMHIGTARTALFNWLYARGRGGKFLMRVEDTDRARSTPEAHAAIIRGMEWLGLDWDGEVVSQFDRKDRHAEVAHEMLTRGTAYKCFATQDEIETFRTLAQAEGRSTIYRSPWRDADPATHPDLPYVIRVKAPREGVTVIDDQVQGKVTIQNSELDDMICLRSDGTPVYMLAVVVDDQDMGVTHVIRGDDHLNNAARQMMVYAAMDWPLPVYAHIPLIHGEDGKKLSKRHGALAVEDWRAMGYPARAMRNYLARLGWAHGDDEVFTDEQAVGWFDLKGIGRSPARLDVKKLQHVTGRHIAMMTDAELVEEVQGFLAFTGAPALTDDQAKMLERAAYCLKERAKSLIEVIAKGEFALASRPLTRDEAAEKALDAASQQILALLLPQLQTADWNREPLEAAVNQTAEQAGVKFAALAGPLRAALAGRQVTPSVIDMMLVLGRDESLARIGDVVQ
ncbi:MAG: glutamate--tRNA ligase [Deltaproteobacteria bacterium]